jgi:hypothetical protein
MMQSLQGWKTGLSGGLMNNQSNPAETAEKKLLFAFPRRRGKKDARNNT